MGGLAALKFEIHGKVQGVFFRKYTDAEANKLGLVGWVRNEPNGTVVGEAQGPKDALAQMKLWLKTKGSPKSKITKAIFDEREVAELDYKEFGVQR